MLLLWGLSSGQISFEYFTKNYDGNEEYQHESRYAKKLFAKDINLWQLF